MATADKLNRVLQTKTDIKNAMNSKGMEVNDSTPFSEYSNIIKSIKIPSKTSDLTNDGSDGTNLYIDKNVNNLTNYTETSKLSKVATSGSFNDLSDVPTFPSTDNFAPKNHTHDDRYYTESEINSKFNNITPSSINYSNYSVCGSLDNISGAYVTSYKSNKSFGLPANSIKIEYSTNGGSSWLDYGASDASKIGLFSEIRGTSFVLGKAFNKNINVSQGKNSKLRVTIEQDGRYVTFDSIYIWCSTSGNGLLMNLERSPMTNPNSFQTVFTEQRLAGWSGNNIRYFSGSAFGGYGSSSHYQKYRMTFYMDSISSDYSASSIEDIRFYGGNVWTSTNNMLSKNHMYTWDSDFNVTFPSDIIGNKVYNSGADYAECFDNSNLNYKDVLHRIVEVNNKEEVILSTGDNIRVIGVISDNYGHLMGGLESDIENGSKIPVGLAGTLYVDTKDKLSEDNLGKFVIADKDGYCRKIEKKDKNKVETIVGKIIGFDFENNRYKVLLVLR